MTDVEKLLSEDGARWQAAQPPPPEPELTRLEGATRGRPGPHLRWQPVAAGVAVLAVVAGVVTATSLRHRTDTAPPPGGSQTSPFVRDGDTLAGQGGVVAYPGRPVQLCGPTSLVTVDIYPAPPPPPCDMAVTLVGVDLDRLSDRNERNGIVWGTARVEGVYRNGTLTVTRQGPYVQPPRDDPTAPDPVPCPEPPGGWPRQPAHAAWQAMTARVQQVVNQHPTLFNDVYVRYPYGWHLQDESDRKGTEVLVVRTTSDLAEARRLMAAAHVPAQHLCVTQGSWSHADMHAAETALRSPDARRAGIADARPEVLTDRVMAPMLVLDETAARFLASVAGGRVVPDPVLQPVGE